MTGATTLSLKPVVTYPAVARVGQWYAVYVDLRPLVTGAWSFAREEYAVRCDIESHDDFVIDVISEPVVIYHRFGGTYGPARFHIRAKRPVESTQLAITLRDQSGFAFHRFNLAISASLEAGEEGPVISRVPGRAERDLVSERDAVEPVPALEVRLSGGLWRARMFRYDAPVSRLVWSSDGFSLAALQIDGALATYLTPGADRAMLREPLDTAITSVAWETEGRLVYGVCSGAVTMVDVLSGDQSTLTSAVVDRTLDIQRGVFSPDVRWLAFVEENVVRVLPLDGGGISGLNLSKTPITALAWSPDSRFLAIGFAEGPIQVWEHALDDAWHALSPEALAVTSLAWSRDGKYIAAGTQSGEITVFLLTEFLLAEGYAILTGHKGPVDALDWSPDDRLLASQAVDERVATVRLWNPNTWDEVARLEYDPQPGAPAALAFNPDPQRRQLAVAVGDGRQVDVFYLDYAVLLNVYDRRLMDFFSAMGALSSQPATKGGTPEPLPYEFELSVLAALALAVDVVDTPLANFAAGDPGVEAMRTYLNQEEDRRLLDAAATFDLSMHETRVFGPGFEDERIQRALGLLIARQRHVRTIFNMEREPYDVARRLVDSYLEIPALFDVLRDSLLADLYDALDDPRDAPYAQEILDRIRPADGEAPPVMEEEPSPVEEELEPILEEAFAGGPEVLVINVGTSGGGVGTITWSRGRTWEQERFELAEPIRLRDWRQNLPETGRMLFERFIPPGLRQGLSGRTFEAIRIVSDWTGIPWELLHDGTDYLCLRYPVARDLPSDRPPFPFRAGRPWRALVIGDPTDELPYAREEAARVSAILDLANVRVDQMIGRDATRDNFLKNVRYGEYSLVHFAGHSRPDERDPRGSVLLFSDGRLSAEELSSAVDHWTFFFLNTTAYAPEVVGGYAEVDSRLDAFPAALRDAAGYLGVMWFVQDVNHFRFADEFYRHAMTGVPVAEAVRRARLELRQADPNDDAWAPWLLYGDPLQTLFPAEAEVPVEEEAAEGIDIRQQAAPPPDLSSVAEEQEAAAPEAAEPEPAPDVFISYRREDRAFAEEMRDWLAARGFRTWMDVYDIRPGVEWQSAIDAGLRNTRAVVGVLSQEAAESRVIQTELNTALDNATPVILIGAEEMPENAIPYRLRALRNILAWTDRESAFEQLVQELARAGITPSEAPDRLSALRNQLEHLQAALVSPQEKPRRNAQIQFSIGQTYAELGRLTDSPDDLRRAIEYYEQALQYWTRESAPLDYARTYASLAEVYHALAGHADAVANLQQAVAVTQVALTILTPDVAPREYAAALASLARIYSDLAGHEDAPANLRRAIEYYEQALQYWTPESAPRDYAANMLNLGTVYGALAEHEDAEQNLQQAIDVTRQAMEVGGWTLDANPRDFAGAQQNLGNFSSFLAEEHTADPAGSLEDALLQQAADAYQAALEGYARVGDEGIGGATGARYSLGRVYYRLGRLVSDEVTRSSYLNQALAQFHAAAAAWTRQADPDRHAMAWREIGDCQAALGEMDLALEAWREARMVFAEVGLERDANLLLAKIEQAEKESEGRPSPAPDAPLVFTVACPDVMYAGLWERVLVYVHTEADLGAVWTDARGRFGLALQDLILRRQSLPEPSGPVWRFVLDMPSAEVDPPVIERERTLPLEPVEFRVRPETEGRVTGTFAVVVDPDQASARLRFDVEVRPSGGAWVFVITASEDRTAVDPHLRTRIADGMQITTNLGFSGQGDWFTWMREQIDAADAVEIVWSGNLASAWSRYAEVVKYARERSRRVTLYTLDPAFTSLPPELDGLTPVPLPPGGDDQLRV